MDADEEKISELSSIPGETTQNAEQGSKETGNMKKKEMKKHEIKGGASIYCRYKFQKKEIKSMVENQ